MKRCFGVLMAVTFAMMIFVSPVLAEGKQVIVLTDYLRIRLDNETSDDTNQYWKTGDIITINSEDNEWVYYTYNGMACKSYKGDKTLGEYIRPYNYSIDTVTGNQNTGNTNNSTSSTTSSQSTTYYSFGTIVLSRADTVSVRKTNNSQAPRFGSYNNGDTVIVCGEKGSFYKVKFYDEIGYISKQYIELKDDVLLSQCEPLEINHQVYVNESELKIILTLDKNGGIMLTTAEWP